MNLLSEQELIWSPIVANSNMNRERNAIGVNSYEQELKFAPTFFLQNTIHKQGQVKWLDLCCGQGKALVQSALFLKSQKLQDKAELTGIDLVDFFTSIPSTVSCIQFEVSPLLNWSPTEKYDLITCIHGLHYIGDKLQVLEKYLRCLSSGGLLIANLDLKSIRLKNNEMDASKLLRTFFKENGIDYDSKTNMIRCVGSRNIQFGFQYLGANDKAGANYTGQEAVDSYYKQSENMAQLIL